MRNSIVSILLVFTISLSTLYSPRSEALVGLIFKNKIVKTIGGIGAIGGGTLGVIGLATAASSNATLGSALVSIIFMAYGAAITGVGLIILDDNSLADIEFRKINIDNPQDYLGFSTEEIEIYNSEIELLNTIRQTIVSEVEENDSTEDAEKLWLEYSKYLSPETFSVAKAKAKLFVEAL